MNETRQEVTTVRLTIDQRPSALAAVWAPVSVAPSSASVVGQESVLVPSAARSLTCAGAPQLPQVHQVHVQAGRARMAEQGRILVSASAGYGTTGFTGKGIKVSALIDGARGVPPRGRPV